MVYFWEDKGCSIWLNFWSFTQKKKLDWKTNHFGKSAGLILHFSQIDYILQHKESESNQKCDYAAFVSDIN